MRGVQMSFIYILHVLCIVPAPQLKYLMNAYERLEKITIERNKTFHVVCNHKRYYIMINRPKNNHRIKAYINYIVVPLYC